MPDTSKKMPDCIAFQGELLLIEGSFEDVAIAVRRSHEETGESNICVFDYATSRTIEFDQTGDEADMLARLKSARTAEDVKPAGAGQSVSRGPGRPKLGVIAKEITLLPRHWEWLGAQPGGASVTLRRLVDEARRVKKPQMDVRTSQEIAYRFMTRMAGNRENFEEASRALFATDPDRFAELTKKWPPDINSHLQKLAATAFDVAHAHQTPPSATEAER